MFQLFTQIIVSLPGVRFQLSSTYKWPVKDYESGSRRFARIEHSLCSYQCSVSHVNHTPTSKFSHITWITCESRCDFHLSPLDKPEPTQTRKTMCTVLHQPRIELSSYVTFASKASSSSSNHKKTWEKETPARQIQHMCNKCDGKTSPPTL